MANEKILIVDDDKNICELLRLYLNKEGLSDQPCLRRRRPRWRPLNSSTRTWCCWT